MGLRVVVLASVALAGCASLTEVNAGPIVAVPTREDPSVGGGPYAAILGGFTLDENIYFVPGQLFAHTRRDRTLLTFGPMAEIDARFSRPSAVGFLGIAIGIAWASERIATPEPVPVPEIFPPPPRNRPLP